MAGVVTATEKPVRTALRKYKVTEDGIDNLFRAYRPILDTGIRLYSGADWVARELLAAARTAHKDQPQAQKPEEVRRCCAVNVVNESSLLRLAARSARQSRPPSYRPVRPGKEEESCVYMTSGQAIPKA